MVNCGRVAINQEQIGGFSKLQARSKAAREIVFKVGHVLFESSSFSQEFPQIKTHEIPVYSTLIWIN